MIGIVLYIIATEGYRAQLKSVKVFITLTAAQGRINSCCHSLRTMSKYLFFCG